MSAEALPSRLSAPVGAGHPEVVSAVIGLGLTAVAEGIGDAAQALRSVGARLVQVWRDAPATAPDDQERWRRTGAGRTKP